MPDPTRLVADSISSGKPVIVVAINYRLNIFAFGDGACERNLALQDQRLAIEWVSNHIHEFGGDRVGPIMYRLHCPLQILSSFVGTDNVGGRERRRGICPRAHPLADQSKSCTKSCLGFRIASPFTSTAFSCWHCLAGAHYCRIRHQRGHIAQRLRRLCSQGS